MNPHRGVSLVEMLVTLAVLVLVLLALFTLIPASLLLVKRAELRMRASALAQTILEQQSARPYTQIALGPAQLNAVVSDKVEFSPRLEVNPVGTRPPECAKELVVTLTWSYHDRPDQLRARLTVCNVLR